MDLATCPDAKVRNGEQAVSSATRACELTDWKEPYCLCDSGRGLFGGGAIRGAPSKWRAESHRALHRQEPRTSASTKVLDHYKANKPYHCMGCWKKWALPIPGRPPKGRSSIQVPALARGKESVHVARSESEVIRVLFWRPSTSFSPRRRPGRRRKIKDFVRPRKSSATDRAFEYVQNASDISPADGQTSTFRRRRANLSSGASPGRPVLVTIRSQGLRGWASASSLIPLDHADSFSRSRSQADPRDSFALLM